MNEPGRLRRWARSALQLAITVMILASARASLADHYKVPSGSMEPTVDTGDRILVNKVAYGVRVPLTHTYVARFEGPEVGDVVVLDAPDEDKVLLKRVVATPGTTVEVRAGRVILDARDRCPAGSTAEWRCGSIDGGESPVHASGELLHEQLGGIDHAISLDRGGGPDFGPVTIPADRYLVLGDNRGDSRDGRYFGLVTRESILGRAVGVYWRGGPTWDGL
jgi:signal peptidase I